MRQILFSLPSIFGQRLWRERERAWKLPIYILPLYSTFILVVKMIHHSCDRESIMYYSSHKQQQLSRRGVHFIQRHVPLSARGNRASRLLSTASTPSWSLSALPCMWPVSCPPIASLIRISNPRAMSRFSVHLLLFWSKYPFFASHLTTPSCPSGEDCTQVRERNPKVSALTGDVRVIEAVKRRDGFLGPLVSTQSLFMN